MELGRDGKPKNHISINLKLFGSFWEGNRRRCDIISEIR